MLNTIRRLLPGGALISVVGLYLGVVLNFGMTIVAARVLGTAEFGHIALGIAVLNLLGEALGAMFKSQHTVQPELPTQDYVKRLAQGSEAEFDARLEHLCEQLGGVRLVPGHVSVTRKPATLRKRHDVIRVSSPSGVLQKGVERTEIDALGWFDRWLQL